MSPLVPYTEKGMNFFSTEQEPAPPGQHLLYSIHTTIRLHLDGGNREYLIAKRPHIINALAIYNNRLIDAGEDGSIFNTEAGQEVIKGFEQVSALAVNGEGGLFYAENHFDEGTYFSRVLGLGSYEKIAERRGKTHALAFHQGRLVDAGSLGRITYTELNAEVAQRPNSISALASYNDRLVHAENSSSDEFPGFIFYTETRRLIAERPTWVNALAVYKDKLVDAGEYGGIFYTETDKPIVETDMSVYALLPIDHKMANRLLKLPEVEEIR
jgi:hypothetical protein